ncbi:hypothetical protein H2200_001617 [Cladophialophora chaetospira]|uniref:Uncharacterized protein n=1 Tax=Cladophialophora chaetospira TaxID=386627 RepID=A0AA38XL83_9EURO|nr:hypothetical protein H2200_001617 [Cladophialophora chaetospira]
MKRTQLGEGPMKELAPPHIIGGQGPQYDSSKKGQLEPVHGSARPRHSKVCGSMPHLRRSHITLGIVARRDHPAFVCAVEAAVERVLVNLAGLGRAAGQTTTMTDPLQARWPRVQRDLLFAEQET